MLAVDLKKGYELMKRLEEAVDLDLDDRLLRGGGCLTGF